MKICNTLTIYSIAALAAFVEGSPDFVNSDKDNLSAAIPSPRQSSLRGSRKLDLFDAVEDCFGDCPAGNEGDDCSVCCQCSGSNTCEAVAHVCRAPGKHGDYCHLTRPCGDGYWCVDAISAYNHQTCVPDCTSVSTDLKNRLKDKGHGNSGVMEFGYKWKDGVVPFVADCRLENYELALFSEAMKTIEDKTVVRFERYDSSKHDNYIVLGDYDDYSASSHIGRMKEPGAQAVLLDNFWFGAIGFSEGDAIHELIHALGWAHTQSRPDRDEYVNIYFNNIKNGEENHNFEIKYTNVYDKVQRCREYEYRSIMHYSKHAFAINDDELTMEATSGDNKMGKDQPSDQDIEEINAYYGDGSDLCGPAEVEGYQAFTTGGCPDQDDLGIHYDVFNATACAKKCNALVRCVSFEYSKGMGNDNSRCALSSTCKIRVDTVMDSDDENFWYLKIEELPDAPQTGSGSTTFGGSGSGGSTFGGSAPGGSMFGGSAPGGSMTGGSFSF